MRNCNGLFRLTIGALSTMSILASSDTHMVKAESVDSNSAQALCSKAVTGTYLTTITNADGSFASRGLLTLTQEGNFVVGDSSEGGLSGVFNPFTTGQGTWVCTGRKQIAARALDFSLSNQGGQGIARIDYSATFDPKTKTVQGTINLYFFGLKDNPLVGNGISGGTTTFSGQLVTPQ